MSQTTVYAIAHNPKRFYRDLKHNWYWILLTLIILIVYVFISSWLYYTNLDILKGAYQQYRLDSGDIVFIQNSQNANKYSNAPVKILGITYRNPQVLIGELKANGSGDLNEQDEQFIIHLSDKTISWPNSFYFTFINCTTVGFGDIAPDTAERKILSMINSIIGLILFGFLVATITIALYPSSTYTAPRFLRKRRRWPRRFIYMNEIADLIDSSKRKEFLDKQLIQIDNKLNEIATEYKDKPYLKDMNEHTIKNIGDKCSEIFEKISDRQKETLYQFYACLLTSILNLMYMFGLENIIPVNLVIKAQLMSFYIKKVDAKLINRLMKNKSEGARLLNILLFTVLFKRNMISENNIKKIVPYLVNYLKSKYQIIPIFARELLEMIADSGSGEDQ